MKYSAEIPQEVMQKLPEPLQTDENNRIFRAVYKEVCGNACVDMQDIHPEDNTYFNMALYATYQQLYTKTGDLVAYTAAQMLESEAKEMASLEGVDIDRIANSRVYYVACNTRPHAVAAGVMPESAPIHAPYCDTHMQAQQLLSVLGESPERLPPSRYGSDQLPMPYLPAVHHIYTVLAGPEKIATLEAGAENAVLNMPAQSTINPKTVVAVDTLILADFLKEGNQITEEVAYGDKPHHFEARRDMEIRTSAMLSLHEALGKTPQNLRAQVELGIGTNGSLEMCFSPKGFVSESPFNLTYQERIAQLTIREMRNLCNAYTLQNAKDFKDGFLKEFAGEIPSVRAMTEGLQRHLQEFMHNASPGDREAVQSTIKSASTIVNLITHERAESLVAMDRPLSREQRDYLHAVQGLVPEQLRHEFVVRAADQMLRGISNEAAMRFTCVAMEKEARNNGMEVLADRMHDVANNAGMQYELYKDAMENEEVEV